MIEKKMPSVQTKIPMEFKTCPVLAHWAERVDEVQSQSVALVLGVFSTTGELLWSNRGMQILLHAIRGDDATCDCFMNPTFRQLAAMQESDGVVFEGIVTLGDRDDPGVSLKGRVYRQSSEVLVVCEYDVVELVRINNDLVAMNREISILQRKLTHENRRLEDTLATLRESEEKYHHLQQQLAHVARLSTMGEMAAGIAHEMNQPLHAIATFAKACHNVLLQDDIRLDQLRDWNESIAVATGRAGETIKRLLAFANRSESQFVPTVLREVIEESLSFFACKMRFHQVTVHTQIDAADLLVKIDRIQIQQLLVNLFQNAGEALAEKTDGARRVSVRAALAGKFVEISVADNGPGLEGCDVPKIFDPFFSTKPNSMRMGLAISRTIVEAHGGQIWAVSAPEGGAAFHFTLPAAAEGSGDVP